MQQENQRIIILDTETTGMNKGSSKIYEGHRIIEIGAVEMVNRKLTGKTFHQYINPQQEIDPEAIKVHGITNERVKDEPVFKAVAEDFICFIKGATLVAHNANFDTSFIDHELRLSNNKFAIKDICSIVDSLAIAKEKFPGKKNNLDALCKRYSLDNSHRTLHGALLDAEILADVYLMLTGEQSALPLEASPHKKLVNSVEKKIIKVIKPNDEEIKEHKNIICNKLNINAEKYYW